MVYLQKNKYNQVIIIPFALEYTDSAREGLRD